ncbi:hypothetical protein SUGI_1005420 [Cryptomeria japonica]|nr:hypothetical protein SUGI_1005420 [Cryptomeria japonica]
MEDSAVMWRRIKYNFIIADWKWGWYGKFKSQWRTWISGSCIDVPVSTLRKAFQDGYAAITEQGKPLNTSTHHNNNENHPHLEDNKNNNPDLDFDAMEEILRRLPVPSLMRAKSVCKPWKTAISTATFNLNNDTDHFVTQQSYHGFAFFCAALNQWFPIRLPWNKDTYDRYEQQPNLCAAAKGLFLFNPVSDDEPVICNVLTKQHRCLPRLKGCIVGDAVELMVEAGHFEIIIMSQLFNRAHLYDSSTDELKDIHVRAPILTGNTHTWKSTLHNGMAYFTNDFGRNVGCYDFASREFQFMEIEGGLPPKIDTFDIHLNTYPSLPRLVSCNGKLLLVGRFEKEAREGLSIWGVIPLIKHSLVGIWELENNESWSLVSVTPQALLEDTVKSSHGTDFVVAAASDTIWLTIKASKNLLTLNLRSMKWSVLPGYTGEDLVDWIPRRAVCVPFRISSLSTNPGESIE